MEERLIICRTPTRVSFCGGGSDYPEAVAATGGGLVVGAALARYTYVSVRDLPPFHDHATRVVYSRTECVQTTREIIHPLVRACLGYLGVEQVEVVYQADMPGQSGIGSSSSFAVGLLHALHVLRGQHRTRLELAHEAIHLERNLMGECVGSQDQTLAAIGGLSIVRFQPDGEIVVEPLILGETARSSLEDHLSMVYLGRPRTSSQVASSYAPTLGNRTRQLYALRKLTHDAIDAIQTGDWEKLGTTIDRSWRLKVSLSPEVATTTIHDIYATARVAGAWGGKLMGAGGGGCFLLVAPPDTRPAIQHALARFGPTFVPVRFDAHGTSILYAER